ncbi:MAG: ComF family protein [Armatimonadaceae bacterium]
MRSEERPIAAPIPSRFSVDALRQRCLPLRALWEGILDLIYPPVCLICERWDRPPVCADCYAAFLPIPEPVCPRCGRPNLPETVCRICSEQEAAGGWSFDSARAAGVYAGPLREAIHKLKFRSEEPLGPLLGAYLTDRCVVDSLFAETVLGRLDGVVPVPLHPRRKRQRGYNQAELLAKPLAEMLGKPLHSDLLVRSVQTAPQVGLSGKERRLNLTAGAFTVSRPAEVAQRHYLLVDDVFTTGITVNACAAALKEAGAASVVVVTLAAGG